MRTMKIKITNENKTYQFTAALLTTSEITWRGCEWGCAYFMTIVCALKGTWVWLVMSLALHCCFGRPLWAVLQLPPPEWFYRESCGILSGTHWVQPVSTICSQSHSYPRFHHCLWGFLEFWPCQIWWTWCQGLGSLDGKLKITRQTSIR